MRTMRAFVLPLVLGLALALSAQIPTCTKECCSDHFSVIRAFVTQLQQLQQKAKAETSQAFTDAYDQQKAQTYLGLTASAFQDAATHYGQLNDTANQKAAQAIANMLQQDQKQLSADTSGDKAKADFVGFNLTIPLPAAGSAAPAPAAK
jgi:hypothetical protein